MCGSVSSSEQAGQLTNKKWVNSEKVGYRLTSQKMSKSMPVSKQINSVKALGKGSNLEKAIATAALVFYNSAGADGRLTKGEAKEMLLSQFQAFIRGQEGKPKYKEIFADLSEDKEKKIALEDFMVLVISLTIMSDILKDIQKAKI
ncbi:sentan [Lepisosteus oculatus]|uniref:Sentan, cilia apical structure protein n=1 Tax=Lepisosteus oculatus TaxID=7918 RepID=W5MWD6_LEPOC|nr:PREDICTED: sentan isoform X1 [Lepisosteus oculatus]